MVLGVNDVRLASVEASPFSVLVAIILGAVAILVLLRFVWVFVMAFWGTQSALENRGFAQRFWSKQNSRRSKKARHHRARRR